MSAVQKRAIRCAIYTRKSSEEGLEQSFNSLDAQREACQAYILSQRQEGWKAINIQYDDGGYSGGSMERPALKRLLADIDAKKVDTVVVYKVDRVCFGDCSSMKVEIASRHRTLSRKVSAIVTTSLMATRKQVVMDQFVSLDGISKLSSSPD
ncbi:MAG TPA: recombinase family protein [Silvibacterium sp.]|nr:recombinase family protein [Silvibacterium sp.]